MDSNHRYPRERSLLLPRSELARWNRLAAGTGCRLQQATVSAYSNVSNGAEAGTARFADQPFGGCACRRAGSAGGRSRVNDQSVWAGIATLNGLPVTIAPIGRSDDGLPIGVQVIGSYLEDRTTITFAGLIEREFGGFTLPPI